MKSAPKRKAPKGRIVPFVIQAVQNGTAFLPTSVQLNLNSDENDLWSGRYSESFSYPLPPGVAEHTMREMKREIAGISKQHNVEASQIGPQTFALDFKVVDRKIVAGALCGEFFGWLPSVVMARFAGSLIGELLPAKIEGERRIAVRGGSTLPVVTSPRRKKAV